MTKASPRSESKSRPNVAFKAEPLLPWKDRIDSNSIVTLWNVIKFEVDQVIGSSTSHTSPPLQIDFAIFSNGERLVRLSATDRFSAADVEKLLKIIDQLPLPAVRDVVAFACIVTQPGQNNVRFLPPFDRPLPTDLDVALRQFYKAQRGIVGSSAPSSGLGVLVNHARRLWRYFRSPANETPNNLSSQADPLLGGLSPKVLESLRGLSDKSLDDRIELNHSDANCLFSRASRRYSRNEKDSAIEDLTDVIRLAPDVARAYLQRSSCLAEQGQLERALQDVNTAIELCPNHADGYESRGGLYWRLEAWQAAEADFSRCIDTNGVRASYFYWRSRSRWHQGHFANAIDDLDEAIRLNPYYIDSIVARLMIYEPPQDRDRKLSTDRRVMYLDRAIRYGPPNPDLLKQRAHLYVWANAPQQALDLCARALELNEKHLAAVAVRGLAYYVLGNLEQSFADLTKAIDGEVAWPEVYCRRAEIFNGRNECESAVRDAEQALALDQAYAPAWLWRGVACGNMLDYEAARQGFLKACELAPLWWFPHFNLGISNFMQGNYETACTGFSRTIELEPKFPMAWMRRGMCHLKLRQESMALEDLNHALELEPGLAAAYAARAEVWAWKQDYHRAVEDMTSALKLEPENASLLYQRAHLLSQLHEYNRACADFDELIRLCPGLASAYTGRGYIWTQIGHQEQAERDYQEAILCDPEAAGQIEIHKALAEAEYFLRRERYDEAAKRASAALELDPDYRPALRFRAAARWYEEEFVEAVEDYARLLELDGEEFNVLSCRGQVYVEMNEFEAGLADLDRAIALGRETQSKAYLAYARSGRALALAGLDRFGEARDEFETAIADCPENAWVHYNHGRVYDKLGEHRKAALCFQLSLALEDPRLTPRKRERARAYSRTGLFEEALPVREQILAERRKELGSDHPDTLAAMVTLANAYEKAGRLGESLTLYEQALAAMRKKPGSNHQAMLIIMNNIAFILATASADGLRDGRRAVELATEACEGAAYKIPDMLDTLAAAYAETGDFDTAVKWSQKAIELLGSDPGQRTSGGFQEKLERYKAKKPMRRETAHVMVESRFL